LSINKDFATPKYLILSPYESLICIRDELRKQFSVITNLLLEDPVELKTAIAIKNQIYHNYYGIMEESLCKF
jgi:hypothetical protein